MKTNTLEITRDEYQRLKELDRKFGHFLHFAEHANDIRESRDDLKLGKGVGQNELFKRLGL